MEDLLGANNWLQFEHKHIATVSGRLLQASSELVGKEGGSPWAKRTVREYPSLLELLLELHVKQKVEFFGSIISCLSIASGRTAFCSRFGRSWSMKRLRCKS